MNTPKVAAALNTISLAFGELAEALVEGTMTLGEAGRALKVTAGVPEAPGAMPEFPPNDYEDLPVAATAQNEPVLGRCPDHDVAWTVKGAGVSKAGKPYSAFFKCDGKTPDGGFCQKKPTRAWADAHPIGA